MGRRSLARKLNRETKAGRYKTMNVESWLLKPNQLVTREEAYALLRQWHFEVYRDVMGRRSIVDKVFHAIWLIMTAPLRAALRRVMRRRKKQPDSTDQPGGTGHASGESEVVR